MKKKLVLWAVKGSEETKENLLVTLELKPDTNKVLRKVIASEQATEELALVLLKKWKKGEEVALPEGTVADELDLSASVGLLPEGIEAQDTELVQRTQTEWIFIVLSTKLYKSYQAELEEIQEKIDGLEKYSKNAWDNMKNFWSKVQSQMREHNLFKEHSHALKAQTNGIFDQLKKLRSAEDAAFESQSAESANKIIQALEPIEKAINEEGTDLKKLFNKLKSVQDQFKGLKLTRASRSQLWDRIDKAFKTIKEKRSPGSNTSADTRLARRMDGLQKAIDKMQSSIDRDQRELNVQNDKLNSSSVGELETQLREVKAKLIKERISSKTKKLEDMHKTLGELSERLKKIVARQEKEKAAAAKKEQEAAVAKAKEEAAAAAKKAVEETVKKEAIVIVKDDDEDIAVEPKKAVKEEE